MGKTTTISWCTSTWNPWRGCTKVTKACDHCYMFRDQRRYGRDPEIVVRARPATFDAPLKWPGPELIFTCSWSDWFHVDADPWRDEAWDIIRRTPQHTYMVLTKRPGRIHRCLPEDWGDGYPNVWLGVSIEDVAVLHRVDQLRRIPAALRFISAEPLLGSLFEDRDKRPTSGVAPTVCGSDGRAEGRVQGPGAHAALDLTGFGLIIVGGESGSRADARPMHPEWAREIRDHVLRGHGLGRKGRPAFHFKQWGAYSPVGTTQTAASPESRGTFPGDVCLSDDGTTDIAGTDYVCFANESDGTVMRYRGSSPDAGGKLLDGREWCELPAWGPVGRVTLKEDRA